MARGFDVQAIDGIIFSPLELTPAEIDEVRGSVPLVLLGERADPDPARERRTDHVSIDNVDAAAQVTAHLLDSGRRRLGFLGAEPRGAGRTGAQRVQGFLDAHAAAGLDVDERWVLQVPPVLPPGGRGDHRVGAAPDRPDRRAGVRERRAGPGRAATRCAATGCGSPTTSP